jgi:hypothetical protein
VADPVGRHALDAHPGPGRLEPGQPPGQRGQQRVAAAPVDRAHPAQVPVEFALGHEVGQGELL